MVWFQTKHVVKWLICCGPWSNRAQEDIAMTISGGVNAACVCNFRGTLNATVPKRCKVYEKSHFISCIAKSEQNICYLALSAEKKSLSICMQKIVMYLESFFQSAV